jgi:hypothetical protein
VLGFPDPGGASLEPARIWGARVGVGMAAARHLLAAVLLWAAFYSSASFTDPSDGTPAHPRHVVIELLLRGSSALCVHYARTSSLWIS